MSPKAITFGDTVRVRSTDVTTDAGLAGLLGTVHGETTPSVTGVEVIGELDGDYAINVFFEGKEADAWFAPELLEFVDHGAGAEIQFEGADTKWIRSEDGEWIEQPGDAPAGKARPWWKFW